MPHPQPSHDIIVIGASAGGIAPLRQILQSIPADLSAAIFVVVHLAPSTSRVLLKSLATAGLPVEWAVDGTEFQPGHIYVAVPDRHLIIKSGVIHVMDGPRENHARPSIDVTLRTAAKVYGTRVAAVILSGALNDGTHGAMLVKRQGGAVIIQSPAEAETPSMPQSVADHAEVDFSLPAAEIGPILAALARSPSPTAEADSPSIAAPERIETAGNIEDPPPGELVPYTCPECGGALWMNNDDGFSRFQCHTGHAFSAEVLLADENEELEAALWSAVRLINEHVDILRRMATNGIGRGPAELAQRNTERADDLERQGLLIRQMLLEISGTVGGR